MTSSKQQIVRHIQALESDQVKSLVLNWLTQVEENDLIEFEQLLDSQVADRGAIAGDELDETFGSQPLTEEAMVEESIRVLEDYQRNPQGIPHNQVREWLDSLGTDHPSPCPK
jgi:hypothetical protein